MPSESTRAYIYRVLAVAGVVAVGYGLITQEQAGLWVQLAGTILATSATGLAAANTSTKG